MLRSPQQRVPARKLLFNANDRRGCFVGSATGNVLSNRSVTAHEARKSRYRGRIVSWGVGYAIYVATVFSDGQLPVVKQGIVAKHAGPGKPRIRGVERIIGTGSPLKGSETGSIRPPDRRK